MVRKITPLRVLVVDDETLIRWSLSETLTDRGCVVSEAGDARGARNAICDASLAFDVAVLDLRLPDSEDLSLLQSVRQSAPDTQIILMTAFGTPDIMRRALDMGAFRVVNKPFELHELADLIEEAGACR